MEQALRNVERMVEEQRGRMHDLQRGHAHIEEALAQIRMAKPAESRTAERRNRTPPPSEPVDKPRPRTPQRTPADMPPYERTPQSTPYLDDRTPITEVSSRTPRSQRSSRNEDEGRTPRSQRNSRPEDESHNMVRSSTDPNLTATSVLKLSYRDDPRYKETGKEYAAWPAYPEWQDMPLRRFGNGYGKKGVPHAGSHIALGGYYEKEPEELPLHGQHGDQEMVGGLERAVGHGRRKYDKVVEDHIGVGFFPSQGHEAGWEINHGKHHYKVKDHLNDDCSTEVSSSRGSKDSRSSRSSGASSRTRSSR